MMFKLYLYFFWFAQRSLIFLLHVIKIFSLNLVGICFMVTLFLSLLLSMSFEFEIWTNGNRQNILTHATKFNFSSHFSYLNKENGLKKKNLFEQFFFYNWKDFKYQIWENQSKSLLQCKSLCFFSVCPNQNFVCLVLINV